MEVRAVEVRVVEVRVAVVRAVEVRVVEVRVAEGSPPHPPASHQNRIARNRRRASCNSHRGVNV